ncbi:MAG: pantoate--beta-alanine ligase [Gemmatimonadota bacterium]|nr:pantoate--beta-alanine ligase [Gemmatimonadota bacterium]
MPSIAISAQRVSSIGEARAAIAKARAEGARIGLVPTMGALHRGHLSLVDRARRESDAVVMSIFVNPLQFGPTEDFKRYPRPLEEDARLASEVGVDILFTPSPNEMYREGRVTTVSAGPRGEVWEGAARPGHFNGVLMVVAKLFNIVQPDVAIFGRKDLQQASLVEAMVRDLDFDLTIVVAPTIRETDGLALSSRNAYLTKSERGDALVLIRALRSVAAAFDAGERDGRCLEHIGRQQFADVPGASIDYLAVVNRMTLEPERRAERGSAAIVAARLGPTRLIDNIILGENDQD